MRREECIARFKELYAEKSGELCFLRSFLFLFCFAVFCFVNSELFLYNEHIGNHWEMRTNFVKQARKFYPIELDYGEVAIITFILCLCPLMSAFIL